MTLEYVSLDEVKNYSRIQHSAFDENIELLIEACSAAVKNYMGDFSVYQSVRNEDDDYVVDSNYEPVINPDSGGERVVKAEVKLAVLFWVDLRLKNPSGAEETHGHGHIPAVVESLLYSLRDPAVK